MKISSPNSQTVPPESNEANEPETPPDQITDDSNVRVLSEPNIPKPQTNPVMKVQS